jgi:serine/threonine protein kinase
MSKKIHESHFLRSNRASPGPYETISLLGAGGMGEVYRAKGTGLDRTVAIKVLPSHSSSDPELKLRMERKARAISGLQHPNICTLHDIGTQEMLRCLRLKWKPFFETRRVLALT